MTDFSKALGVRLGKQFTISMPTADEAEEAFQCVAKLFQLETSRPPTNHAENLAKALEHYLSANDLWGVVSDTDRVTGGNEASNLDLWNKRNDEWRAMRTALFEYRKHFPDGVSR